LKDHVQNYYGKNIVFDHDKKDKKDSKLVEVKISDDEELFLEPEANSAFVDKYINKPEEHIGPVF